MKEKTKESKLVRSKLYDLIYFESLQDKPQPTVTSAQLAKIAKGGAR